MNNWLTLGLLTAVCLFPGCRSTTKSSPSVATVAEAEQAAAVQWRPTTFVDKPELQVGTGPMDTQLASPFLTTDSGLKYRVLRNSDGRKPTIRDSVTVNYRGWLDQGKVFDSSYERGEPTSFALQKVVAGWTEGMQLVGQGGMIELWVPSRLGYGAAGSPGSVPAHADLHFVVELLSVQ